MNRLRFGIIGAGHLGKIHTRLIQANPEVDLIGVVDPIAETRANVVADFKVPTFANHADLNKAIPIFFWSFSAHSPFFENY